MMLLKESWFLFPFAFLIQYDVFVCCALIYIRRMSAGRVLSSWILPQFRLSDTLGYFTVTKTSTSDQLADWHRQITRRGWTDFIDLTAIGRFWFSFFFFFLHIGQNSAQFGLFTSLASNCHVPRFKRAGYRKGRRGLFESCRRNNGIFKNILLSISKVFLSALVRV